MKKQLLLYTYFSLFAFLLISGCSKKSDPSPSPCSGVTIVVNGTTVSSSGTDGSISASATGSSGFTFNLNGGAYQASGNFNNLAPGSYAVIAKDANGCTGTKTFTVNPTKSYLLTQGTWKFKSATAGGTDISSSLQTCQKDNIMTFAIAGTGTIDEGPTKCNPGDPQTSPLTWNFASGETILHISATLFSGTGNDFTLISLTATDLVVSIGYAPPVGPIILIVLTFQH